MNVAEDAYFTNQYLDRKIRSPKAPFSVESRTALDSGGLPALLLPQQLLKSSSISSFNTIADPDELHEVITPAQLTYLQRIDDRNQPQPVADYYHPQRREAFPIFASEAAYSDDPATSLRSRKRQAPPLSGYYIDQKKRYDSAEHEAKPNIYTHKTFKLVFSKDRDERFNPADTVFVDSNNLEKLDLKETIQRAFKNLHKKITKDNYSSYDYYGQRLKEQEMARPPERNKSPKRKWKFLLQKSRPEPKVLCADEKSNANQEIFVTETDAGGFVPEVEAMPLWKTKWQSTKKAIEDRIEEMKERETEAVDDRCEEFVVDTADATVLPLSPQVSSAPANNFTPMWNNILSWVAYQQVDTEKPTSSNDCEAVPAAPVAQPLNSDDHGRVSSRALKRNKVRSINHKTRSMVSKWNQPVSSRIDRRERTALSRIEDRYPSELEISDDDAEEMYLLDLKRQLQPYRDNTEVITLASGPDAGIMSNINRLIKSIRLMQIIFAPIDVIQEKIPSLQTAVILIELVIFVWLLYELSLLIDAFCMAVRAVCAPMIAIGKFMNRIM